VTLSGKVAIVTGAGTGIGRAIAERFAREGAVVVASDIDGPSVTSVCEGIARAGHNANPVSADAGEPAAVEGLVNDAIERHGAVHIGVANAAVQYEKGVEDTPPEEWDRVLGINLRGAYLLAKYLIPHFREQGGGALVNMASVNAFWVEPHLGAYSAAKGGLIALTKSIALDYGRFGIRCNCICPGYIDTGMAQRYFDTHPNPDQARREAAAMHALARLGQADEVASMAVFLASDDASFCTGQPFIVDGGLSAGIPATSD
jgi:meso-butanediol dehydrogenase/(S,S)-butanediol dehydrogenase/diacetyl reductase